MDEVGVSGEAVEQVLHRADVVRRHAVRSAVRDLHAAFGPWMTAEAAGLVEEGAGIIRAHRVAGFVPHVDLRADHGAAALPPVIHIHDLILPLEGAFDGVNGTMHDDLVVHV